MLSVFLCKLHVFSLHLVCFGFIYLKDGAVLKHGGWWYTPVIQLWEGKENHVFKVTLNYTKREGNWVTRETKIPRESFTQLPRLALNCTLSSASRAAGTTDSHFSAQVPQSENAEKPKTSHCAPGLCRGVVLKL